MKHDWRWGLACLAAALMVAAGSALPWGISALRDRWEQERVQRLEGTALSLTLQEENTASLGDRMVLAAQGEEVAALTLQENQMALSRDQALARGAEFLLAVGKIYGLGAWEPLYEPEAQAAGQGEPRLFVAEGGQFRAWALTWVLEGRSASLILDDETGMVLWASVQGDGLADEIWDLSLGQAQGYAAGLLEALLSGMTQDREYADESVGYLGPENDGFRCRFLLTLDREEVVVRIDLLWDQGWTVSGEFVASSTVELPPEEDAAAAW